MDRSVLDAGLAVLSLASGPVLGAFLVGVFSKRVNARSILIGMAAGTIVLVGVWWTGAVAWTWYAFTGAAVTAIVALASDGVRPKAPTPSSDPKLRPPGLTPGSDPQV
jgi:Na+/proline symporter